MAKIGKTALVTGASGGIGEDLARLFARDGYDLVLVARSAAKLEALGAELAAAHGIRAISIAADLSDPAAPEIVAARLAEEGIEVAALVNNAGYGLFGRFAATDWATERNMIELNVTALTHLTKLVLPGMLERRAGRILNVASTAAFQPGPLMAVYYATKAYVLSFSEAVNREVKGTGVTVTALCPGPTETRFAAAAGMGKSKLFKRSAVMPSTRVAEIGYAGMMRGKSVVVPGALNRFLAVAGRFVPRDALTSIVYKMQEPVSSQS